MKKRILKVLKNRNNWPSIIVLIVSIAAAIWSFVVDDSSLSPKVIITLLFFIAFEFFVLTVLILEDIQSDLDSLVDPKRHVLWRNNYVEEVKEVLEGAREDFIITGGTLSHLNVVKDTILRKAKEGVDFRLLALDIEKEGILDQYNKLIERGKGVTDLSLLDDLEGYKNIHIRKTESLPLAYYIAADLDSRDGIIIAIHLFSSGPMSSYPCIKLSPGDGEWYEIYKKQIKTLWDKNDIDKNS